MHLDFDDGNYLQEEDAAPKRPIRRKKANRRANLLMDADAGVDEKSSAYKETDDKNDYLCWFIIADDVEFENSYHMF